MLRNLSDFARSQDATLSEQIGFIDGLPTNVEECGGVVATGGSESFPTVSGNELDPNNDFAVGAWWSDSAIFEGVGLIAAVAVGIGAGFGAEFGRLVGAGPVGGFAFKFDSEVVFFADGVAEDAGFELVAVDELSEIVVEPADVLPGAFCTGTGGVSDTGPLACGDGLGVRATVGVAMLVAEIWGLGVPEVASVTVEDT